MFLFDRGTELNLNFPSRICNSLHPQQTPLLDVRSSTVAMSPFLLSECSCCVNKPIVIHLSGLARDGPGSSQGY